MKKILLFSLFLILGLVGSQLVPNIIGTENYMMIKPTLNILLYIALAFIMINVGREFELDKTKLKSYTTDYFIAMATAAAPWIFVCLYFMYLLPDGSFSDWGAWKENLLLSRFAAPTSAGILFTMLAAANLKKSWVYKKTQVLAIFDDLDTILLMIPLQVMMIGMKWQLAVIIVVVLGCLIFGWKKLSCYNISQKWGALLSYALILAVILDVVYKLSKSAFGSDGAIHIEILLPAFVLGMVINTTHNERKSDIKAAEIISYIFMFLVGMSSPLIIGAINDAAATTSNSITAAMPEMGWGEIILNVVIVTLLSNLGKMFPLFAYRSRSIKERLALSIGMFTRGEVGAGIIFIAIGYGLGGPLLTIALLTIVANLLLTGVFVVIVKKLTHEVEADKVKL